MIVLHTTTPNFDMIDLHVGSENIKEKSGRQGPRVTGLPRKETRDREGPNRAYPEKKQVVSAIKCIMTQSILFTVFTK